MDEYNGLDEETVLMLVLEDSLEALNLRSSTLVTEVPVKRNNEDAVINLEHIRTPDIVQPEIYSKSELFTGIPEDPFEIPLDEESDEFYDIVICMNESIRKHKGNSGGDFNYCEIENISRIYNKQLFTMYTGVKVNMSYKHKNGVQQFDCENPLNEKLLWHGFNADNIEAIIRDGLDPRRSRDGNMFGDGIYLTDISSKANQYVSPYKTHNSKTCTECSRQMLLCRTLLGDVHQVIKHDDTVMRTWKLPPNSKDSVVSLSQTDCTQSTTQYREYIVYNAYQVYPEYLITYHISKVTDHR